MGPGVAPTGTVAIRVPVVAEVTVPFTAPKNTWLAEGVALNPLPCMVTEVPGTAERGENPCIKGWEFPDILNNPVKKIKRKMLCPRIDNTILWMVSRFNSI
jgi:hypothetical protein